MVGWLAIGDCPARPGSHLNSTNPGNIVTKMPETTLRIVGGRLRGRKFRYSGDERTRPMKDRAREAVFNLIGPAIKGTYAIDLFAGTGALALEAVSRGSLRSLAIERHFPSADLITQNAKELGSEEQVDVFAGDTFIWGRRLPDLGTDPCVVFCSPPYALYTDRAEDMLRLITTLAEAMPVSSKIVVEADGNFDWDTLPDPAEWDVRTYHPAVIGVWEKPTS